MTTKEITKKASQRVIEHINPATIGSKWKKIMYVSGIVSSICGGFLIINPFTLPVGVLFAVKATALVSGAIAGRGFLDRSGKKINH